MKILCLALWQPWATLYAHGIKLIETRPSYSSHRGITGILATKTQPPFAEEFFYREVVFSRLSELGYKKFDDLPRGGVIGASHITAWKKMMKGQPVVPVAEMNFPQSGVEREFGNYEYGRYGVFSKEVYLFKSLFQARGQQSMLFEIDVPKEYLETATVIPTAEKIKTLFV